MKGILFISLLLYCSAFAITGTFTGNFAGYISVFGLIVFGYLIRDIFFDNHNQNERE